MNPSSIDPFEQAFFDFLEGDQKAKITVHNNKGDDEIMPVSYFFRKYSKMPELEKIALKKCEGKILDIGAGSGCHSLYLQAKGMEVTALDIKPGFVEVMKKRGIKKTVLSDIRKFKAERFDTLLMLMNGIGFTKNFQGLQDFFTHSKTLLNPGGQIVLDSSDLLYLYEEEDGSYAINLAESYYGEVEYQVEYKGIKGQAFKWLFVDYSNLSFYAEEAGYRCELLFEDGNFNFLAILY
ncbi:MAG: methyltransferase domain-containing protein [Bacteroidales bacterium]|nr:methyltransferase domain-containing protein [Bacteroidales bacterium]MCF8402318.1 methyltransferase domain-containing protein [Bacteroidales bacterium]